MKGRGLSYWFWACVLLLFTQLYWEPELPTLISTWGFVAAMGIGGCLAGLEALAKKLKRLKKHLDYAEGEAMAKWADESQTFLETLSGEEREAINKVVSTRRSDIPPAILDALAKCRLEAKKAAK